MNNQPLQEYIEFDVRGTNIRMHNDASFFSNIASTIFGNQIDRYIRQTNEQITTANNSGNDPIIQSFFVNANPDIFHAIIDLFNNQYEDGMFSPFMIKRILSTAGSLGINGERINQLR